jgi:hypothetical protein
MFAVRYLNGTTAEAVIVFIIAQIFPIEPSTFFRQEILINRKNSILPIQDFVAK